MNFKLGSFVTVMEHGINKAFGIVTKVDGELHDVLKVADGAISVVQNVPGVADEAAASVPEAGEHGTHVIYPLTTDETAGKTTAKAAAK